VQKGAPTAAHNLLSFRVRICNACGVQLVLAKPANACKKLTGRYSPRDKDTATLVLVRNKFGAGGCDGRKALANVAAAGASGSE
jgi:hypothetical protein